MGFFESLETKSKETKQTLAFLVALSVTLVIAGVWGLSLPARFAEVSESAQKSQEKASEEDASGGLTDLISETRAQLGAVRDSISTGTSGASENGGADVTRTPHTATGTDLSAGSTNSTTSSEVGEVVSGGTSTPRTPSTGVTASSSEEAEESSEPRVILIATTSERGAE